MFIKRVLDIVLGTCALLILLPLMILICIIIRTTLGSPVIYKQTRPGLNTKPFTMYKFRSMSNSYDAFGNLLPDELRITQFGSILRKISLDELPQLINVIKGEMSIVGPRPLLMEYLPLYTNVQMRRHNMKPGITNWGAVNGRNTLSWEKRLEYDVWYVDHWSLALDIKIMWLTLFTVISTKGVNYPGHSTMPRFTGVPKNTDS